MFTSLPASSITASNFFVDNLSAFSKYFSKNCCFHFKLSIFFTVVFRKSFIFKFSYTKPASSNRKSSSLYDPDVTESARSVKYSEHLVTNQATSNTFAILLISRNIALFIPIAVPE
ncbi:hypothetical protein ACHWQZ_G017602 [Mnemiopsis leidyi]